MVNAILGGLVGAILGLCGGIWYGHMIAMRVINKATEPQPVVTPPVKK